MSTTLPAYYNAPVLRVAEVLWADDMVGLCWSVCGFCLSAWRL